MTGEPCCRRSTQPTSSGLEGFGSAIAAHVISRSLALAEAKLGEFEAAAARLDALIAEQRALGVHGLQLGASYEARTRVAIGAGDTEQIAHYGQLTAAEYRHGTESMLTSRYERLLHDAERAGSAALPQLREFRSVRG